MQQVIEMARIVRERHGKPLKMPLRSLTVVAGDAGFLADLQGELRHYVLEEVRAAASHGLSHLRREENLSHCLRQRSFLNNKGQSMLQ